MSSNEEKKELPTPAYDVMEVAGYVLKQAKQPVTHLKLHKMLYFIQGNAYRYFGKAIFHEDMSAWSYGPVIPELYRQLSGIIGKGNNADLRNRVLMPKLDLEEKPWLKEWLDEITAELDNFTPAQLVNFSHAEGSPWFTVWDHGSGKFKTISKPQIRDYFNAP